MLRDLFEEVEKELDEKVDDVIDNDSINQDKEVMKDNYLLPRVLLQAYFEDKKPFRVFYHKNLEDKIRRLIK